MFAMCLRKVSRFVKPVITLFIYIIVYCVVSNAILPKTVIFLSDEFRVGDKYALLYLESPTTPVFSDSDGANVFKSRQCGRCFITNNIGFLPLSAYDAILVTGDEKTVMTLEEKGRKYLIETTDDCIKMKFNNCAEPKIKSLKTMDTFDLCGFCDYLQQNKKPLDWL